jgi:transposase InsO family protein
MAYSNNPNLPRVRLEAVRLVQSGWSTRRAAKHFGFSHSAIVKWMKRIPNGKYQSIPTRSSKPWSHPHELERDVVEAILEYRRKYQRGAEVLQELLKRDGILVSLSSVKRTIRRNELSRYSKWKKWHVYPPRPRPEAPGILVEADTIHIGASGSQIYIYTLLDVCSRWAYAIPSERITTHHSLRFVEGAVAEAPFEFQTLQTDHGSEFSKWFSKKLGERDIAHRHSRIRTPNDNAHLERFNRTIQEECIAKIPRNLNVWRREIPEYLKWYNEQRPHLALEMKSPIDIIKVVPSY